MSARLPQSSGWWQALAHTYVLFYALQLLPSRPRVSDATNFCILINFWLFLNYACPLPNTLGWHISDLCLFKFLFVLLYRKIIRTNSWLIFQTSKTLLALTNAINSITKRTRFTSCKWHVSGFRILCTYFSILDIASFHCPLFCSIVFYLLIQLAQFWTDFSQYCFDIFVLANGFEAIYNPPDGTIEAILNSNSIPTSSGKLRRRRAVATAAPSTNLTGVSNPTACLEHGEPLMFGVSNNYFPEYDDGNLFNTNKDFDFGAFKDLSEKQKLMGTNKTLFSFKFEQAGVYVLRLNSASDSKMVRI